LTAGGSARPRIVSSEEPSKPETIRLIPRNVRKPEVAQAVGSQIDTRPCFTSSWIGEVPMDILDVSDEYMVSDVKVKVLSAQSLSAGAYVLDPPEYRMNPVHIQVLSESVDEIVDALPKDIDIDSLAAVRPRIKARAKDLVYAKLAERGHAEKGIKELDKEAELLSRILCKYTAGYGVLETLLEDPAVQDIYVDAPSGQTAVHVVLRSEAKPSVRQKCRTNVFVSRRDLQGFVSRVKFETGMPFSEAHPVLEADMRRLGARVTLVSPPISDKGVAVAIRKHSESTWPLHTLVSWGTLSPLLASLLWACVIGRRTVLIAGSRGAGKTTLLATMLLEFPLSQRMIVIEDTPEVPVRRMQDLGYDVQALRFSEGGDDLSNSAEGSLRVSLRMGESAIVIGEVRGSEAKVLYESMRAGSAGSSVLGTIHGNSAKGVLDRAVEDLGVTERAFSSTDIIVVIGLIRSPDGTRFSRRVTEVSEVRGSTGGVELVPLFLASPGCRCAKPTQSFSPECKTVVGIAGALGASPAQVMEMVKARAHADQLIAEALSSGKRSPKDLADDFRVRSNEVLNKSLFSAASSEAGLQEWRAWFDAKA
jgi:flagellar protein FlaI